MKCLTPWAAYKWLASLNESHLELERLVARQHDEINVLECRIRELEKKTGIKYPDPEYLAEEAREEQQPRG